MKLYTEELVFKNSRVKVLTDRKSLISAAYDEIIAQRQKLEDYIRKDVYFLTSLKPYNVKSSAPEIARKMAHGAEIAGVGPMAAVAGIIAEYAARKLADKGAKVAVVENGGDVFAITDREITIGLFSGQNKVAEKLAFRLNKTNTPISICSSSSKLGHSLSFGKCDLATVFSEKSYVADSAATAVANKVRKISDIDRTLNWGISLEDVEGVIIIKGSKVGMIGNIPKLFLSKDSRLKDKITRDPIYEF